MSKCEIRVKYNDNDLLVFGWLFIFRDIIFGWGEGLHKVVVLVYKEKAFNCINLQAGAIFCCCLVRLPNGVRV